MNGALDRLNGWTPALRLITPALLALVVFFLQQLHQDFQEEKELSKETTIALTEIATIVDALEQRMAIAEGNITFNRDRASEARVLTDALEKSQGRLWEEIGRLRPR